MKTISPYFRLDDIIIWVQSSPVHAVIACAIMYFTCWIASYYLKELI